ncbi:MAG: pilin [Patescibacteria group bacterium]
MALARNKKLLITLGILSVAIPLVALAAGLVPCGTTDDPATPLNEGVACNLCHLYTLAQGITNWLMFTAAPLAAVLAIAVGGFYILISGENAGMRSRGFGVIKTTVIGLLITFAAWIVINELLLFFAKSATQPAGSTVVIGGGKPESNRVLLPWNQIQCFPPLPPQRAAVPGAPAGCDNSGGADDRNGCARLALYKAEIQVKTNYCQTFNGPAEDGSQCCTTVAQLPNDAVESLVTLQKALKEQHPSSNLNITGGTEQACHTTHGPNIATVDISKSPIVNDFICRSVVLMQNRAQRVGYDPTYDYTYNNVTSVDHGECSGAAVKSNTSLGPYYGAGSIISGAEILNEKNHWHIEF